MIDPKKLDTGNTSSLRKRAEELYEENKARIPESGKKLSIDEMTLLLHELRVHQIELEMQNEELLRAQGELDEVRARYFDLYDLAPVGYCTVSDKGIVLEANLTLAKLLAVSRGMLFKQPFSRFILKEDQEIYYLRRKQLFDDGEPQSFDLRMVKKDGTPFWANLVTKIEQPPPTPTTGSGQAGQAADAAPVCRIVISDITERNLAEQALKEKIEDLQRLKRLTVGRELAMIELKKEVNELLKKTGQEEKYRIVG